MIMKCLRFVNHKKRRTFNVRLLKLSFKLYLFRSFNIFPDNLAGIFKLFLFFII